MLSAAVGGPSLTAAPAAVHHPPTYRTCSMGSRCWRMEEISSRVRYVDPGSDMEWPWYRYVSISSTIGPAAVPPQATTQLTQVQAWPGLVAPPPVSVPLGARAGSGGTAGRRARKACVPHSAGTKQREETLCASFDGSSHAAATHGVPQAKHPPLRAAGTLTVCDRILLGVRKGLLDGQHVHAVALQGVWAEAGGTKGRVAS